MVELTDELIQFFGSQLLWIFLLVGGLVTSLKYLDKKQTDKIRNEIRDNVSPLISKVCEDITQLKFDEEKAKEIADIKVKHLEELVMHFQALMENREINDYRLRRVGGKYEQI